MTIPRVFQGIGNFQKRRPEFELPKNQALLETGEILGNLKTGMPIRKKPIPRNTIGIYTKSTFSDVFMNEGSQVFQASLTNLDSIMKWAREIIHSYGFSKERSKKFEVAVEEALVNIISYAYKSPSGLLEIRYRWDRGSKQLTFCFIDQGEPFNPLSHQLKIDTASTLQKRREGGLGIHFMKELTDFIEYQRLDNSNILTMSVQVE